jgi:hypothetical protein
MIVGESQNPNCGFGYQIHDMVGEAPYGNSPHIQLRREAGNSRTGLGPSVDKVERVIDSCQEFSAEAKPTFFIPLRSLIKFFRRFRLDAK